MKPTRTVMGVAAVLFILVLFQGVQAAGIIMRKGMR